MKYINLAIIGCGNMAQAIVKQMTSTAVADMLKLNKKRFNITVSDTDTNKLKAVSGLCRVTTDNNSAVSQGDYVLLAVKPQIAKTALNGLNLKDKTIISIMAGVSINQLARLTGAKKIVRVMPNLNAAVGDSYNAYSYAGIDENQLQEIKEILGAFGQTQLVEENIMDAVTGISGCGPAFVFSFIKAFYEKALDAGFSEQGARGIALSTVIGSAYLVEAMPDAPIDALINSVCSPGGATIKGVELLREHRFENIVKKAIEISAKRAGELSQEYEKN